MKNYNFCRTCGRKVYPPYHCQCSNLPNSKKAGLHALLSEAKASPTAFDSSLTESDNSPPGRMLPVS